MVVVPEEVVIAHGQELKTDSLKVAKAFDKHHYHVVRDIENIITQIPENFSQTIFGLAEYVDKQGKPRKMYEMTKDGFMLLVMGYNTAHAMDIKIAYINAFNQMQHQINSLNNTLIAKLLAALEAEKQSFAMASLAGRILRQRKEDKQVYQQQITAYEQELQPMLLGLEHIN